MEKEILLSLENKNFEKAKEQILSYERMIAEEKAIFTRSKMIEKLNYFKKIYASSQGENVVDINLQSIDGLKNIDNKYLEKVSNKLVLHDKMNQHVCIINNLSNLFSYDKILSYKDIIEYNTLHSVNETYLEREEIQVSSIIDCEILNCCNTIFENLNVEQTIYIESTKNCTIISKSKQIRIKDSRNLSLFVYVDSGISIENCYDIRIYGIDDGHNKFQNINDFSCPFGGKNYLTFMLNGKY